MKHRVLIDTDAIVGALNERDQWHRLAAPRFSTLPKPFYTCEAVISEACFRVGSRRLEVIGLIRDGVIEVSFSLALEIESVQALMKKYFDVPMSLADACLVRMSEIIPDSLVFSFDSDFKVYRQNRNRAILTVPIGE